MKNYKFATIFVTAYLIVYTVLHSVGASFDLLMTMFILSPFLVLWMAYTIVKYAPFHGRELEEDEEWGYQDKDKSDFN